MDEEWKRTVREFEKVWPRVEGKHGPPPPPPPGHGPGTPPPPEDGRELEKFIREESEAERQYTALAEMTKGKVAEELRRLAAGSRRLVKQLQTEYYLLTGDTCRLPPPPPPTREGCLANGLRRAWQAAREAEKEFEDAAARTRCDRLAAVYREAAEEKRRQRKTLFTLLRRVIA